MHPSAQAVRGGSRLMSQGGGHVRASSGGGSKLLKVWPLMDAASKELR
jgi:hypothetical protein